MSLMRAPRSSLHRMEKILGWKFIGKDTMTGLPEYRNGSYLSHQGKHNT